MSQSIDLESLQLSVSSSVGYEEGRPGPRTWSVLVDAYFDSDNDTAPPRHVFWMDGWTFEMRDGCDLAEELDAMSADTEVFIPIVDADGLSVRLVDDYDFPAFGAQMVLINHVRLAPELRGLGGIGRFITGLAIRQLDDNAAIVALCASPFELREQYGDEDVPEDVWNQGAARLGRLWETLGFEHFEGSLYVLDPTKVAIDRAVAELRRRIGELRPDSH